MMCNDSILIGLPYAVKPADSRISLSPVIVVLLAVGIVAVLIGVGLVAMGEIVDISRDDVDITTRVSGNDVMITVLGGDDVRYLTGLCAYIDGMPRKEWPDYQSFETVGETIIFPGLATGTVGSAFVIVEAKFDDGTTGIVNYARLQFS